MQIYNYDNDGFFVSISFADESPLEPGVFLIPAKATTVEPPVPVKGKVAKWEGTAWVIVDTQVAPTEEPLQELTPEEVLENWRFGFKVTRFQAHAALLQASLLSDIKTYMALPETDEFTKLAWESVQEFRRMSPLVITIGTLFNLNDIQLDDLFKFASTIEA